MSERNLRKEPKLESSIICGGARRQAPETFGKRRRPGRLDLSGIADCSGRTGRAERGVLAEGAKDWDALACRKKPNPWREGAWLGAEEDEDLRKPPKVELISEK